VAARSKAWVCAGSLAGIVGSNPAGGVDICLMWVLSSRDLQWAEHSSSAVRPSVISKTQRYGGLEPLGLSSNEENTY
jgi:hypothetical protein